MNSYLVAIVEQGARMEVNGGIKLFFIERKFPCLINLLNRAIYVTVSHVSESLLAHYHLLHRILITNELKNGLLQGDQSSSLVILISSK